MDISEFKEMQLLKDVVLTVLH